MTAVIAGTQFRGQFESRMKGIIDECKEYGNIILVIDEIHNIIGAGDGEHSMNAANILKPSLSNREIQLIGTTTLKEYRKYIEKDTALERRFQQVLVEEPNIEDSIVILEGIKKYYEEYHKVKISSDVIKQTVIMSEKYIHDRFLPDKAIDILDEACSRKNLENKDLFKLEIITHDFKFIESINKKYDKDFKITSSGQLNTEISSLSVTKANAIDILCKHFNINLENTYAIGDHLNDLEMLKKVNYSGAVNNAVDDVKKIVNYISTSYDKNGFANFAYHIMK